MANTTVSVYQGGTGSATAGTARTALGVVNNATHTGDVTGSTALTIATDAVDIAMLSATGTASASTFLRGDNTWSAPSGSGDVTKVGTPVDNQVGVWTGDGTIEGAASLVFDSAGLGVGTATPVDSNSFGRALDVVGATGASLFVRNGAAPTTNYGYVGFYSNGLYVTNSTTGGDLFFRTENTEKMRIYSGGRVTVKKSSNSEVDVLTSSIASIAIELDDSNNFSHTMTEDTTLANPTSTLIPGQSGCIVITQDGGASEYTMSYGSNWHFEGQTEPTLSTGASQADNLVYYVASATSIHAVLLKNFGQPA